MISEHADGLFSVLYECSLDIKPSLFLRVAVTCSVAR